MAMVNGGRRSRGFTFTELAIVLVIVAVLVGTLLTSLLVQLEAFRVRETRARLAEVRDALLRFAVDNARLPCPADPLSDGRERRDPGGTRCNDGVNDFQHGFVPATTLGLAGPRNANGLLLDAWGEPIRYSVSAADNDPLPGGPDGRWDFVADGELASVGLANLKADLQVCSGPAGGPADAACLEVQEQVAAGVPAVLYSLGADATAYLGLPVVPAAELENAGELPPPGQVASGGFPLAGDQVFVSRGLRGEPDVFDDLVEWLSPHVLYLRLIEAGVLP